MGSDILDIGNSSSMLIDNNYFSSSADNTKMMVGSDNSSGLSIINNWFYSEEQNTINLHLKDVQDIMIKNNSVGILGDLSTGYLLDSVNNATIFEDTLNIYGSGSIGINASGEKIRLEENEETISGDGATGMLFIESKDCRILSTMMEISGEMSTGIKASGNMNDLDIISANIEILTENGSAVVTDHGQGRIGIVNMSVNSSMGDLNALHLKNGTIKIDNLTLLSETAGMIVENIDSGSITNLHITGSGPGISFDGAVIDIMDSIIPEIRLFTIPGTVPKGSWITAIDSDIGSVGNIDMGSELDIWNTIGIQMFTKELEPYPDVDLEIMSWDNYIYQTDHFTMTNPDPKTDDNGTIADMLLLDRVYNGSESNPILGLTNLTVHVIGNSIITWDETFTLNTSYPHRESFISPDIDIPQTPMNFSIRQGETKQTLFLNWDPNNDDTIEYWIYQLDPSTTEQGLIEKVNLTRTSWVSPDLGPSKQMYYWVTAWDGTWESEPSELKSGTTKDFTAPLSPEIYLGEITRDSITIMWTHPGPADLAGFVIYMSRPGSPDFEILGSVGPELREYTATGLEWGTTYQFRIQAFDDSDNYSPMGDILDVTTITPLFEIRVNVKYDTGGPMAGEPANECLLELLAFNGTFIVASETDENGTASFFVDPFESYSIRAIPDMAGEIDLRSGYLSSLSELINIDGKNQTVYMNFTLEYYLRFEMGTVRLKVSYGEGRWSGPAYGALVTLLHENGTTITSDATDADGAVFFEISDLPIRGRFHIVPPEGTDGDPDEMRSGYLEMTTNFFELTLESPDVDLGEIFLEYYTYIPPPDDLEIMSISPYGSAVDLGSPIIIKFNQPVNTTSVELALSIEPPLQNSVIFWEDENKIIRIEHDDMAPETDYTVTVGVGARSEEGTTFPAGYLNNTYSFRTTALPDSEPSSDDSKYIVYAVGIGAIVLIIIILIYSRISSKKKEEEADERSYSPFEEYEEDEFYEEDYPDDIAEQMEDELPFDDEDDFLEDDGYEDDLFEEEEEFDEFEEDVDEYYEGGEEEEEPDEIEDFDEDEGMEEEMEEVEEETPEEQEQKPKKRRK
jgi:hypothetical protein